ncbi:hypothetical protein PTSG_02660 [Salpingoeca rosetta]|uniref:ODAD1 central coiled coil region domain-containing protein n=1 Tax=Salpingoeca rosetta (strain ATCC 50818 / BSB-021) TaxID=946362 RepID=F2U2Y2_SALR5|nr:uncharacterized protein PTSG_02660 [Salpingoeca rosetta]EGD81976.1 hypothetical protein PTSG_02660 [Salpingoeca rosetta]|eukprot:XP_004996159.1 hypothetical protein PTSG_02660 [Salpingoeca rosetta]
MATLGRTQRLHDEAPDELKKKLTLLEGDRKAYYENSQAVIKTNKDKIAKLKKENKQLTQKLKDIKLKFNTHVVEETGTNSMQEKITKTKMRRNTLRHEAKQKEKRLEELKKQLHELTLEEAHQQKNSGGASQESQKLRTLENRLDKANIKFNEAQHVGKTYKQIIRKLEQDRLHFDNSITELEKTLSQRKEELVRVEAMCVDACKARDEARKHLAAKEKEISTARKKRDEEKSRLKALAEERRRQFEAMEKRLRMASAGVEQNSGDKEASDECKEKLETYEQAMRRIRDATGASDVNEVVQRFATQGETQDHLKQLQQDNTEQLHKLRQEHQKLQKQFEALKYSGEARNTGNQRMLAEFEAHLRDVERRGSKAQQSTERATKVLVALSAGVEALYEKLGSIKPVQFRAASNVQDKLTEAELRLKKLNEELEARKNELPGGLEAESIPYILPEHNTRVPLDTQDADGESDSDDDDEFASRDALKKQAQALVDAKTNKKRRRRKP